jgi:multidrug efflux system membrane fusion protein
MTPHSNDSGLKPSVRPPAPPKRRLWPWIGLLLIAAGALVFFLRPHAGGASGAKQEQRGPGAKGAAAGGDRKPSVSVTTVTPKPFAVILEGLGTVTPLATVTVRPQVDGPLQKVAYREGAEVHRGELLAEIDPRPFRIKLAVANATMDRDKASLHNAQLDLTRYESLRSQNLIAQQQLDLQHSTVDQAVATVAMDQANVDDASLQLTYTRITSPIDGVAGIRVVDPGNQVHAADTTGIVILTQLDPITVIFTLPQDELPRLALAMEQGERKVTAVSRAGDEVLGQGRLTVIDNQVNSATGTVRMKAEFNNPDHRLWPNLFVRARIEVAQQKDALTLPATAVQQGPLGPYVYVLAEHDVAKMRPITLEVLQGEEAVIASGIKAGERVVVEGQDRIKPNSPVKPRDVNASAKQARSASAPGSP